MNANLEMMQKQNQEVMANATKSYEVANKGLQSVAKETADFTKQSYEAGTEAFQKLSTAKTADKVMEIQGEYAKSAYEAFIAQATKMGELYTNIAKDAYKPFEKAIAKATDTK